MNDYDKGYEAGLENGHEGGFSQGYDDGKKFAQDRVANLMDEVIFEYKKQKISMSVLSAKEAQDKLNAVEFMKNWVCSGGHEDEDGNRVCLVW